MMQYKLLRKAQKTAMRYFNYTTHIIHKTTKVPQRTCDKMIITIMFITIPRTHSTPVSLCRFGN